tara:strand:- start:221 stop:538 length:318 start_codon:yes stop_codon:yes gene_type:complete
MKNEKYRVTITYSLMARSIEAVQKIADMDMQDRNIFKNDNSRIENIKCFLDRPLLPNGYLVTFSYEVNADSESSAWRYAEQEAKQRRLTHDDSSAVLDVDLLEVA